MSDPARAPARILVVEDQRDRAEALALNLEHAGHHVECAADGRDALAFARTRPPDLILLDLTLPRVDELTVLRTLRAESLWCPVLIPSARSDSVDKVEGFRLDADDYVTKPFTLAELLGRVAALLRRAAQAAPVAEPAAAPGHVPAATMDIIGYSDAALVARFGLTARQAAVVRLVARGLTNPEVADALDISRFTARSHAEQVLAKLGIVSRGRVAAALRATYDADQEWPQGADR